MPVRRRQQVPQRDRPAGRHRVVDRAGHRTHHDRRRQLRQQRTDRLVQLESAIGDEGQGQCRHHRLGDRSDPEQRVLGHRPPTHGTVPEHDDVQLVAPPDCSHQPRDQPRVDERAQGLDKGCHVVSAWRRSRGAARGASQGHEVSFAEPGAQLLIERDDFPQERREPPVDGQIRPASAAFLARILDLPQGRDVGHFTCLPLGNGVTIDVMETQSDRPLHLAFLVDDTTFDRGLASIHEEAVEHWADPGHNQRGTMNHRFGGRGVYFADPCGQPRTPHPLDAAPGLAVQCKRSSPPRPLTTRGRGVDRSLGPWFGSRLRDGRSGTAGRLRGSLVLVAAGRCRRRGSRGAGGRSPSTSVTLAASSTPAMSSSDSPASWSMPMNTSRRRVWSR